MDIYEYEFENRSGIDNMAVDEALLETVQRIGVPVFRFYTWNEPTLSLGYFQRYEDRKSHPASLACPAVRRLSGGGAIVHDRELTYCLAVPSGHELATEHRLRLYETIHRAVIGVLSDKGIKAFLAADVEPLARKKPDKEIFLCFQRIAPGDVVTWSDSFGWVKLLGSAQYRDRHGGVLQHGSLLLERSMAAPELPGLSEGGPNEVDTDWAEECRQRIAGSLGVQWKPLPETIRKEMESSIAILREKRYADGWVRKR